MVAEIGLMKPEVKDAKESRQPPASRRGKVGLSPTSRAPERGGPAKLLDFRLLASRTIKEYISFFGLSVYFFYSVPLSLSFLGNHFKNVPSLLAPSHISYCSNQTSLPLHRNALAKVTCVLKTAKASALFHLIWSRCRIRYYCLLPS